MSGEYYGIEEKESTKFQGYDNEKSKEAGDDGNLNVTAKKSQDLRLHDIEEQLEVAENRCNILKSQLDYMKQIYGVNKNAKKKKSNSRSAISKRHASDSAFDSKSFPKLLPSESNTNPPRQNSNQISTDTTGAAVRTINNILNGITDSVNRLSELYVETKEKSPRKGRKNKTTETFAKTDDANHKQNEKLKSIAGDVTEISSTMMNVKPTKSNTRKSAALKLTPDTYKKTADPKGKSLTTNKSTNSELFKKKNKYVRTCRTSMTYNASAQGVRKTFGSGSTGTRRYPSMLSRHKLVEIYHNDAAKNSDSENDLKGKKEGRVKVPPLKITAPNESQDCYARSNPQLTKEYAYNEPEAPRTSPSCIRSYELPTIASRMKQVAKNYLNTFNFKAIPFCVALATTPSHNIGINIQQVMNIIKNKQPVKGISPTLFHNIGLAAERLNSRPLSAFISTVKSSQVACPMNRISSNYQGLQEAAKAIPDDTIEECDEEEATKSNANGPSGDTDANIPRQQTVWALDSSRNAICTCVPREGVDFKQVVSKYNRSSATFGSSSQGIRNSWRSKYRLPPTRASLYRVNNTTNSKRASKSCFIPDLEQDVNNNISPFQGKEKSLKEVLSNLHKEFETLNTRYDELSEKAATDKHASAELERLEKDLDNKEEEITMVMSLYKEVVALKQQVKELKENHSGQNMNVVNDQPANKFTEYNNPTAALHLTKLLRQIQHYQNHYKK